ncbi:MAG: hypothetical protein WCW13_00535 [archaeon]|jgi:hypothetical protein
MESKEIIKSINKIYEDYFIPLNLRRHMIFTAGVADQICNAYNKQECNKYGCNKSIDAENVIATCLIHDLGNIVKMDFTNSSKNNLLEALDRNRLEFFIEKQKEFFTKYGQNDTIANNLIAKEIGANKRVIFLLENKEIQKLNKSFWNNDLGLAIFAYSDLRVAPYGVTSMQERLGDFYKRYNLNKSEVAIAHSEKFVKFAKNLEKEIFKNVLIKPEDITNESIQEFVTKFNVVN